MVVLALCLPVFELTSFVFRVRQEHFKVATQTKHYRELEGFDFWSGGILMHDPEDATSEPDDLEHIKALIAWKWSWVL